jgi:hypothetical protein
MYTGQRVEHREKKGTNLTERQRLFLSLHPLIQVAALDPF